MHVSALSLRKAIAINSTATDFTAKIPTTTEPTGTGVFRLTDVTYGVGVDGKVPDRILLLPYGGNASNDIFNMRVWGWSPTYGPDFSNVVIYVPVLLVELACTLGNNDATALGEHEVVRHAGSHGWRCERKDIGRACIQPRSGIAGACAASH